MALGIKMQKSNNRIIYRVIRDMKSISLMLPVAILLYLFLHYRCNANEKTTYAILLLSVVLPIVIFRVVLHYRNEAIKASLLSLLGIQYTYSEKLKFVIATACMLQENHASYIEKLGGQSMLYEHASAGREKFLVNV